jgi:hypothetical protein
VVILLHRLGRGGNGRCWPLADIVWPLAMLGLLATACSSQNPTALHNSSRVFANSASQSPSTSTTTTTSSSSTTTTSGTRYASTSAWANEGSQLVAAKASHQTAPGGAANADSGDWAYESAPVDITGNGTYQLRFSVPSDFGQYLSPASGSPVAFSFEYPPDVTFQPVAGSVSLNGTSLTVSLTVSHLTAPYDEFTVWIY